jgi:hypothetical protein
MLRYGLRYNLSALVGSIITTLLVLGSEVRGSALPEPERTAIEDALQSGRVETLDTGHGVHRT